MLVALKLMEEVVAGALCARRGSLWSSSSSPKTWVILLEVFACFLGGFWVVLRGGQSFFKFEKGISGILQLKVKGLLLQRMKAWVRIQRLTTVPLHLGGHM
ncbi:hypothetical protein LIER_27908 [Lithospermum erythrorhizon]|uniref:Uncharacterized protein n=1 Tax=Lithospermum erythrorhizon TaxID=34254 RepID=A0AAV3RFE7_LITER